MEFLSNMRKSISKSNKVIHASKKDFRCNKRNRNAYGRSIDVQNLLLLKNSEDVNKLTQDVFYRPTQPQPPPEDTDSPKSQENEVVSNFTSL